MDRNCNIRNYHCSYRKSLSARRAWIEISEVKQSKLYDEAVALRKESVDRNPPAGTSSVKVSEVALRKESVDRNHVRNPASALPSVALRKESVDRNFVPFDVIRPAIGRSPQGERG